MPAPDPNPDQPRGLRCPRCGCPHWFTTHTERRHDNTIRRRKTCRHCGLKIVTNEYHTGDLRERSARYSNPPDPPSEP